MSDQEEKQPDKSGYIYKTNHYKEFEKRMDTLGRRHGLSRVFNDLLTMAICSFHQIKFIEQNVHAFEQESEELYLNTIKAYEKDEVSVFPKLVAHMQMQVIKEPYSDILGEYFTEHITQGHNGQFFTPQPVCEMMALLHGKPGEVKGKNINDPACGSGRMLLAFAKLNPDNHFYASDNSATCAKMTTINFFLNGLKGEVSWQNSLSQEWYGAWRTNTYFKFSMPGIMPLKPEESVLYSRPVKERDEKRFTEPLKLLSETKSVQRKNKPEQGHQTSLGF